jgi:hypothetical protein
MPPEQLGLQVCITTPSSENGRFKDASREVCAYMITFLRISLGGWISREERLETQSLVWRIK